MFHRRNYRPTPCRTTRTRKSFARDRNAVERYDGERGTELLRTLEMFLDQRGNLAHTAEALFIHVNTLRQRLDQLLGNSWREPDEALQLQLALRAWRLLGD